MNSLHGAITSKRLRNSKCKRLKVTGKTELMENTVLRFSVKSKKIFNYYKKLSTILKKLSTLTIKTAMINVYHTTSTALEVQKTSAYM